MKKSHVLRVALPEAAVEGTVWRSRECNRLVETS